MAFLQEAWGNEEWGPEALEGTGEASGNGHVLASALLGSRMESLQGKCGETSELHVARDKCRGHPVGTVVV